MTSNEIGRVAFRLFGVYLIVGSLLVVAKHISVVSIGIGVAAIQIATTFGVGLLVALVFNILPGLYLLHRADSLADRVFPNPETHLVSEASRKELFVIGLALFGAVTMLQGLFGCLSAAASFTIVSSEEGVEAVQRSLLAGATSAVGGALVLFVSARLAKNAA